MYKGFVIMACDTGHTSYTRCAKMLEKSIRKVMPSANVKIITNDDLPHGDQAKNSDWKLQNDWQIYDASPFDYTIKLEADMYIPKSIEYWWDILKDRDIVISTHARNYHQQISESRFYRKFIDDNKLPDCYNGITYFKKSKLSENFFQTVKLIFENWKEFQKLVKSDPSENPTTDFVYALASHIIGIEKTTMPCFTEMSMVHMKKMINGLNVDDWRDQLIYEVLPDTLRIGTVPQKFPVHYHIKDFVKDLEKYHV